MDNNEIIVEKMMDLKEKASAFSEFLLKGIEFVIKHYPKQVQFVKENKNKSFDEIMEQINKEMLAAAKG